MSQWPEFDAESQRIWVDLEGEPQRVVDADTTPSPTYALPAPADATPIPVSVTPQSRVRRFGHGVARVGLAILMLLVGVMSWILLALPAGALGCLVGLAVSGALIAGMLYAVRASFFWRW